MSKKSFLVLAGSAQGDPTKSGTHTHLQSVCAFIKYEAELCCYKQYTYAQWLFKATMSIQICRKHSSSIVV